MLKRRRFATVGFFFLFCLVITPTIASGTARPYLMGSTPFFADPAAFPDWKFENLSDKDIISLHIDDFLGVPWTAFQNGTAPPAGWTAKITSLKQSADASGKIIYLAITPIGGATGRKSLTGDVDTSGNKVDNWAPIDSSGCYTFSSDSSAGAHKTAYINYAKYMIDTFHPKYVSPGIEINVQFTACSTQKAAWIAWYSDVQTALKTAYPNLVVFPTFDQEHMYGISDPQSQCSPDTSDAALAACFQQRLQEALAIPGDRIAFSLYPFHWKYSGRTFPYEDAFTRVQNSTTRRIWISETGWPAVPIFQTYEHPSPASSCSSGTPDFLPATAGPLDFGNDAAALDHMTKLLQQAQSKNFEAVIWWLNRDYLDHSVAAVCPCVGTNDTCTLAAQSYTAGGSSTELLLRLNGNIGLRYSDGTPRSAYSVWAASLSQPLATTVNHLNDIQIFPSPMRPALGHTRMHFTQLPAGARLRVYTLAGEKVNDLTADAAGAAAWDGTNQAGEKAASGVYFVYVQSGSDKVTLKVAIQR